MAVTFRSKNEVIATASADSTVTEPASAASGDMLVTLAIADAGTSLALPSGWTTKYGPTTQGAFMFVAGYVPRGGSAPNLTFPVTGSSKYREIHVACLQGSAAVSFDSSSAAGANGQSGNTTPSHNPDPPSTTAVAASSLAIAGGANYGGSLSGGWGTPSGYVIRTNNTAGNDAVMATKSLAAPGAENPAVFTNSAGGVQDYWDGFTMTFTDVAGGGGRTSKNIRSAPLGTALGVGLGIPGLVSAPMLRSRRSRIFVPERMAA